LAHFFSNDFDLAERLDINKQYTTKALLYLLVACGEVRRRFLLACISADTVAGRLPPACAECTVSQDIPNSVLTMLYIVEMGVPPSTMVLLSFATSLTYLGCAFACPMFPHHSRLPGIVRRDLNCKEFRIRPATCRRCRYKISHLWQLPMLIGERAQLSRERVVAFTEMQRSRTVDGNRPTIGDVQDWTDRQCADWLKYDVDLPEHVPLFMGGAIDGSRLLRLDEPKLKALGINAADWEIILARLQLLKRADCRSKSKWQRHSSGSVLYETPVELPTE
jgi:hypothetical protein